MILYSFDRQEMKWRPDNLYLEGAYTHLKTRIDAKKYIRNLMKEKELRII